MATMRQAHQDDMQVLHDRVASIVKRKDDHIASLSEQTALTRRQLASYDDMFAKERQNLMRVCDVTD